MAYKGILSKKERMKFYILHQIGNMYIAITGKTEYKLSFRILGKKYIIERCQGQ